MRKFLHLFFLTITMMASVNSYAAKTYVWTDDPAGNLVSTADAFTATFTATKDDVLNIGSPEAFASVECEGVKYDFKVVYGTETGAYKYSFPVKTGQVVTIKSEMWMNPGTRVYIVQGVLKPTMTNLTPGAQGQPFLWSTQGMVTVNFNKGVTATNVYVQCPTLSNAKFPVDEAVLGGSSAFSCNITNALNSAYEAGLKPGMPFLVKFEGIKDGDGLLYAQTGVLTITYITPQQQGVLVSATVGDGKPLNGYKFKSWFPTDETEGLFVFEFSKELAEMKGESYVELQIGNPDLILSGQYYHENMPCRVEGNKLYVDARGKLRSLTRMFPSVDFSAIEDVEEGYFEFNTDYIGIQLKNVRDKDGNPMYSHDIGSVGSFSYTFAYEEIKDDISWDGDRMEDADGSVKASNSLVQLWVDQQLKSIDGAQVYILVDNGQGVDPETGEQIYATGMLEIKKEDMKILSSNEDETIIGFNLPELKAFVLEGGEVESGDPQMKLYDAAVGTKIRVVIQVNTMNGMPHDLEIFYYNQELPTGIYTAETTRSKTGVACNIAGQRVTRNAKGLIIIDGKKIFKK